MSTGGKCDSKQVIKFGDKTTPIWDQRSEMKLNSPCFTRYLLDQRHERAWQISLESGITLKTDIKLHSFWITVALKIRSDSHSKMETMERNCWRRRSVAHRRNLKNINLFFSCTSFQRRVETVSLWSTVRSSNFYILLHIHTSQAQKTIK